VATIVDLVAPEGTPGESRYSFEVLLLLLLDL
jgi:hypothetical protein